jgi:hypothetical protein
VSISARRAKLGVELAPVDEPARAVTAAPGNCPRREDRGERRAGVELGPAVHATSRA